MQEAHEGGGWWIRLEEIAISITPQGRLLNHYFSELLQGSSVEAARIGIALAVLKASEALGTCRCLSVLLCPGP